jgi:dipeptidyl-peptidase-4
MFIWVGLLAAVAAPAQDRTPASRGLSVETIFGAQARAQMFGGVQWSRDGESYAVIERAEPSGGSEIVRYAAISGARTVIVPASELMPAGATAPLRVDDFQVSADAALLLLKTNSRSFRHGFPFGDFWLFNVAKRSLRRIGGDAPNASLMYAELSPDGNAIAYVRDANLYVEPADGSSPPRRLTTDGSDRIVNGFGDWAYEEEFGLAKAFSWSPDSRRIAFWRFDMSAVGTFYMIHDTVVPYPEISSIRYPKVGTANSTVSVGTVDVITGRTTWLRLPGDPAQNYVPQMNWAAQSQDLLLQVSNRRQNRYAVLLANAATGESKPLFVEQDAAWIDANPAPTWIHDGRAFLWLSERDGWRHLYAVSRDGKRIDLRTPGRFDVVNVVRVDEARGWIYFIASPDNPTQRHLYRAALTGKARIENVAPDQTRGWSYYDMAPNARWAIETYSTFDTPPVSRLMSLTGEVPARVLKDNPAVAQLQAANPLPPTEFLRLDIGSHVKLDAWLMKPPGFDPHRKYPVLFYVYGEPFGVTVTDLWGGTRAWWHRMLAQQGYVVVSIDPRGTPQPRGRAWRKSIYQQVGILASADLAAGARQLLSERPYLDPQRVGVWGWSGGGAMTMNSLFRYPDLFKTGIAVAGPTDLLLYDTIYQERYMGLREDNPDGYRDGSPITFAGKLQGNLLLIHGTDDDNVHYQHLELLVDRLVAANKQFTMMAYPGCAHFVPEILVGNATSLHMFTLMKRYLDEHLKRVSGAGADVQ